MLKQKEASSLVRWGIAKSEHQANNILISIALLCLVLAAVVVFMGYRNSSTYRLPPDVVNTLPNPIKEKIYGTKN